MKYEWVWGVLIAVKCKYIVRVKYYITNCSLSIKQT